MKVTKVFLTFVAVAAMMFVSCGKEESNTNNGGGSTTTDTNNMAQVGNLTTPLTSELRFDDYGTAFFDGSYVNEAQGVRVHFAANVAWNSLGKTLDLTSGRIDEEFFFRYEAMGENGCEFTHRNSPDGTIACWLNHSDRMEEPIFSSGTLTTAHTETGYTLKVEGTLTDGTAVLIKMDVPFAEEIVPLTRNSVIYDGVKYEFTTTASRNGGTGNVTWNSTGDNNVSSSGTIYYGSNNLGLYLDLNPTGDDYHFELNVNVPGLQLSYNWHDDLLTGTLNGEAFTSTPFTSGEASISAYYNQMRVTLVGTLSNGKVLKLFVDSTY